MWDAPPDMPTHVPPPPHRQLAFDARLDDPAAVARKRWHNALRGAQAMVTAYPEDQAVAAYFASLGAPPLQDCSRDVHGVHTTA